MTMRDCPDGAMRDQLPLYVSGRLDARSRSAVEAHLAGCAECAAEVAMLSAVGRAFPVPAVDVARIAAAMPRRTPRPVAPAFYRQPLWRLAASLTLFITGAATYLVVRSGGPGVAPQVAGSAPVAETTLALATPTRAPAGGAERASDLVAVGTDLSELTDAQLQSLLGSLDGLDSRPQAEPTTITVSITQDVTQAPGRSNP